VFLLAFVNTWNAFFLPLTVLRGENNWTLNIGLYNWSGKRLELIYGMFADDVIDLQHTEVPASAQGKGVGDALVRAALAYARERDLRVIATCPCVQAWLRRHPEERP